VAYQRHLFFDGRTASLEQQAREPLFNRLEMGNPTDPPSCKDNKEDEFGCKHDIGAVVDRLKNIPDYRNRFQQAFQIDIVTVDSQSAFTATLQAISSFERTLISTDSLFDRWVKKDAPISWAAQRGWKLFIGKARCSTCHVPPNYTDDSFHNIGLRRSPKDLNDKGRASFLDRHPQSQAPGTVRLPLSPPNYLVREAEEKGANFWEPFGMEACAYKTPSLRNVEHTRPYMHTGEFKHLKEVIAFYNQPSNEPPCGQSRDWRIQKLDLDDDEQEYILEFLKTLSGTKVPPGVPQPTAYP
jgi:cytochrome c peroxidase